MPETRSTERGATRPDTAVAIVGVLIGLAYLAIGLLRGEPWAGAVGLLIMLVYTGLMYGLRRRSETAQLLSGNPADERQHEVMQRAAASTTYVLVLVILGGALIGMAVDWVYAPVFAWLAAVGGAAFVAAVAWHARRT